MKTLVQNIEALSQRVGRDLRLMEVCGTHTMAAFRSGLRQLLPGRVHLVAGPGCPVCVTDPSYLDAAIDLCGRPGVIVATFGDLVRVPGTDSSLERERAAGASVLMHGAGADGWGSMKSQFKRADASGARVDHELRVLSGADAAGSIDAHTLRQEVAE